jgi:hypothetical protein
MSDKPGRVIPFVAGGLSRTPQIASSSTIRIAQSCHCSPISSAVRISNHTVTHVTSEATKVFRMDGVLLLVYEDESAEQRVSAEQQCGINSCL